MGKRTIKKEKTIKEKSENLSKMIVFLEKKWNNKVCYTCECCLQEAYLSEVNNKDGYVTDEELVLSSNNKLKYK